LSSSRTIFPASAALSGLNPASGFCFWFIIEAISWETATSSSSRVGGVVAALRVAIVSFAISIGPPGSAIEMASPATNGARRSRIHSSSV
jgi:hypothetical protein